MKKLLAGIFNKLNSNNNLDSSYSLSRNEKIIRFWDGYMEDQLISAILTSRQRFIIKIEEEKGKLITFNADHRPKIMDTGQGSETDRIIEITSQRGDNFAISIPEKGVSDLIAWAKGKEIKEN